MVNPVRRALIRAGGPQTIGSAATIISSAYLLSRLLGLLRDRLLIAHFGKGPVLDAYNAAFRLPDLIYTLLVAGAFAVAFIPVFSAHLKEGKQKEAWRVASSLLTLLVIATVVGALVIMAAAGPLTTLLTPGFGPFRHDLTVSLTRIMLVTPIFFAISSVLGSIQQTYNRFAVYALSGVLYNLGIIAGIIFLSHRFGIYGVAVGVVGGVVLQALLQVVGMHGLGFRFRPELGLKLAGTRQVLKLMVPRSLDQGIDQINYIFETVIGSTLARGSIVAFTLANNLKNVPLVLISSSITTAAFPRLVTKVGKDARQELIEVFVKTARMITFLAIPSAVFAIIGRGYIVRLLYGFGDADTANTLGWFAGTILFAGLFQLVSRIYFAMQDTKTPLYVSVGSIPINIGLSFLLSHFFGVSGLAMAASFVAMLETSVLLVILRRREGDFGGREVLRGGAQMLVGGIVMAVATYFTVRVLPLYAADKGFVTLFPKFLLLLIIGVVSYLLPCSILRVRELGVFWRRIKATMIRSPNLT